MRVLIAPMASQMDDDQDRPDPRKAAETGQQLAGLARAMARVYVVLGSLVAGVVAGWVIDHYAGTEPRWTLITPVIFLASTILSLVRSAKTEDKP